jgi:malonyl CoA-acyl carrier protein transacylase
MDEWVFLFPGQGSQRVGMVQDFLDHYPQQTRGFFNIAQEKTGVDLLKLSLDGPEEELNLTYNTQPALLTPLFSFPKKNKPFQMYISSYLSQAFFARPFSLHC